MHKIDKCHGKVLFALAKGDHKKARKWAAKGLHHYSLSKDNEHDYEAGYFQAVFEFTGHLKVK